MLLNYGHNLTKSGEYSVQASRRLPYASVEVDYFSLAAKDTLETRDGLDFSVDENATLDPHPFQPWLDQLKSADPVKRHEAALTLASVAPLSLETHCSHSLTTRSCALLPRLRFIA